MINQHDETYLDLCRQILERGELQPNRTGVNAISLFGLTGRYDLRQGFPLLTTKKVNFEAVKAELAWFLKGEMNIKLLPEKFRFLWRPWADKDTGDCKKIYGHQWVGWTWRGPEQEIKIINQIQEVLDRLKKDPTDRRLVVSAWNVGELDQMCLPPCHVMFQLKAYPPYLDLMMFQRSNDFPVGVPFNIASYALLLMMIAQEAKLIPRYFIHSHGDAHIYENQVEGIQEQLSREPRLAPTVHLADKPFWQLQAEDVELVGYDPHPFIKFPVAV